VGGTIVCPASKPQNSKPDASTFEPPRCMNRDPFGSAL
jgi:hypothetical protein